MKDIILSIGASNWTFYAFLACSVFTWVHCLAGMAHIDAEWNAKMAAFYFTLVVLLTATMLYKP